jgi:hypothetical protein
MNGNSYHNIEPMRRDRRLPVSYRGWAANGTVYYIYRQPKGYRAAQAVADMVNPPYFYAPTLGAVSRTLEAIGK